ncbi:MAG: biopolymer transporter ExbD [Nitrospinae bacterium]|nr:biopolymer transporter ExbD [Nitrospinota bacterium]
MRFRKEDSEDFRFDLTPMADIVFLLLIFFMVCTAFVDFTRRVDIELPESKASTPIEKIRNYIIEMGIDKKIYLNGEGLTIEGLEERLKGSKEDVQIHKSAIIKADRRLPYGDVIKVMGIVKGANIEDISVAVK